MNEANSNKKQPLLSLTTTPTKADMYADNANLYSSSLQSKSSLNQTDDEENKYDTINGGDDSSTIIKKESISTLYENCTNAIQHLRQNIHQKRAAEDLETKEILQNVYRSNKNAINGKPFKSLSTNIRQRCDLRGHCGKIFTVAWNSSSTEIMSCGSDAQVIIWDPITSNKRMAFRVNSGWFMCSSFNPMENFIALAGLDNRICIYKLTTDELGLQAIHPLFYLEKHLEFISDFRYISETKLLSSSGDSNIIMWDIERREPLQMFENHCSDVTTIDCHPGNSENLFISSSQDGTIKIWDSREKNACVQQISFGFNSGGNPRMNMNYSVSGNESMTGTMSSASPMHQSSEDVTCCKYFPDGNAIIAGFEHGATQLIDLRSTLPVSEYRLGKKKSKLGRGGSSNSSRSVGGDSRSGAEFMTSEVCFVNVSKSGAFIYSVYDEEPYVAVWNTLNGSRKHLFDNIHCKIGGFEIDESGHAVAIGLWNSTVRIFA